MKAMIYKNDSVREVLSEGTFLNYRYWIISLGTHPCAYVEISKEHPYRKINDYDRLDINVHGGITYLRKDLYLKESVKNSYIIGWDYAHCFDYMSPYFLDGKKYTTEEIFEDVKDVIKQLILKVNEPLMEDGKECINE